MKPLHLRNGTCLDTLRQGHCILCSTMLLVSCALFVNCGRGRSVEPDYKFLHVSDAMLVIPRSDDPQGTGNDSDRSAFLAMSSSPELVLKGGCPLILLEFETRPGLELPLGRRMLFIDPRPNAGVKSVDLELTADGTASTFPFQTFSALPPASSFSAGIDQLTVLHNEAGLSINDNPERGGHRPHWLRISEQSNADLRGLAQSRKFSWVSSWPFIGTDGERKFGRALVLQPIAGSPCIIAVLNPNLDSFASDTLWMLDVTPASPRLSLLGTTHAVDSKNVTLDQQNCAGLKDTPFASITIGLGPGHVTLSVLWSRSENVSSLPFEIPFPSLR